MKMNKLISALLALTLTLPVCACSFAESDTVTLAELKATAPESVSFTIGGEVYDAPVILPEADEISLLLCKHTAFDTSDLREKYPWTKGTSSLERKADSYSHFAGSPEINYNVGTWSDLYGKTDVSTRQTLPIGETPPENTLTTDDVLKLVQARVAEFGGDPSVDLRVWRATAMSGLYRMKMSQYTSPDGKVSFRMPAIDPEQPIENASMGAWNVSIAQYIGGMPILPGIYFPEEERDYVHLFDYVCGAMIYILNKDVMQMSACTAEVVNTLAADLPLAPFQMVADAIQQRIDEGWLQSVYRITLGYTPVPVRGEAFISHDPGSDGAPNAAARCVLVPTWNVEGYDLKDRSTREMMGYTAPDRQTVLHVDPSQSYRYEVRFDAQTGEPLKYYEYSLEGNAQ
ncbi:MAG: hypothetical protein PHY12_00845 [Eubacteriales bacterium]|nr:hypothetical protein [Eubacteriales bacterium]